MNCQIDDIAVIVAGSNTHKLVLVMAPSHFGPEFWFVKALGAPMRGTWDGEPMLMTDGHIQDARLRSIRGQPGPDESLQWTPVPGQRKKQEA